MGETALGLELTTAMVNPILMVSPGLMKGVGSALQPHSGKQQCDAVNRATPNAKAALYLGTRTIDLC